MILILCRVKKFPKRWEDTVIIFYVATYVACAALPFALLHKEINFTVNFTSWIWNLLRFLGCLFFGCFVFWPKKTLFYLGCTGIFFFFVIIQGFPPGYFDDPSVLILAQIFGKKGFFGISEILSLFHFLDLEFDRISAAFCCSANSFFGGTAVFFVMILLDDESLDDDDFR